MFTTWGNTYSTKDVHDASLYYEVGTVVRATIASGNYTPYAYSTLSDNNTQVTTFPREFTVGSTPAHYYVTYWRKRVNVEYTGGIN